jgi:hypothetical protein
LADNRQRATEPSPTTIALRLRAVSTIPGRMKLAPIALVLLAVLGSTGAFSADQVMIAGIGSKSCAHWTSAPDLKSKGEDWALGFWSALNYVAGVTKTQNQLIIDPNRMLAEIEKMCAQRPDQSIADSVWITFLTLNKSQ